MRAIRGGRGLGDSIYVAAIARHLIATGRGPITVCADYPDVFSQMPVKVEPHRRDRIQILAHYSARKSQPSTDQFTDCCIAAGLTGEAVDLRLNWRPQDAELVDRVRAAATGRRVVLVQLPRAPMGRSDGFGAELLPDCATLQRGIDRLRERGAFVVQVGAGKPLHNFARLDLDLANTTTVGQLIDLAATCDGMLGYVSYFVPLAEALCKPAAFIWSRRGLRAAHNYVRQITPQKVLHRKSSAHAFDDCTPADLSAALRALV